MTSGPLSSPLFRHDLSLWNILAEPIPFRGSPKLNFRLGLEQHWPDKSIDLNQDFLDLLVLTRCLCIRSLAVSSEEEIQKIMIFWILLKTCVLESNIRTLVSIFDKNKEALCRY
jgi:hypothetical protein